MAPAIPPARLGSTVRQCTDVLPPTNKWQFEANGPAGVDEMNPRRDAVITTVQTSLNGSTSCKHLPLVNGIYDNAMLNDKRRLTYLLLGGGFFGRHLGHSYAPSWLCIGAVGAGKGKPYVLGAVNALVDCLSLPGLGRKKSACMCM